MTIDDYFAAIERGLRQNVHIGTIEESIICLASDDYNVFFATTMLRTTQKS